MGKRIDREGPIHDAILSYLRVQYPRGVVHHSANETDLRGKDVARAIAKQKWRGMVVGWPDLEMILDGSFYAFEIKAEGNYATDAQKEAGRRIGEAGGYWAVVRSIDDVRECMTEWTAPVKEIPLKGEVG